MYIHFYHLCARLILVIYSYINIHHFCTCLMLANTTIDTSTLTTSKLCVREIGVHFFVCVRSAKCFRDLHLLVKK